MKGRTWCIDFQDSAKKDGDVQIKYTVIDASGARREIRGTWEGYKKGDSPEKKAERFFTRLNSPPYNQLVGVKRAGNLVCFQLKDNAPYQDILGVEVGDQTGQNFHVFDDPADESSTEDLEVVRFRIAGVPQSCEGEVRLGLGQVAPLARVATHEGGKPLEISVIIESLVNAFNEIYETMGYQASSEGDEIVIPEVPCKLGTRGGTNDTGLDYWLSMADPEVGPFSSGFDKHGIMFDAIRLLSARLDLAGIPSVRFINPELTAFAADGIQRGMFAPEARKWVFTVVNDSGSNADDMHVTLAGTGGSLRNPRIIIEPAGCKGRASITNGNRVDVVWDSPCVKPWDTVAIIVDTDFVPLQIVDVVWTLGGKPIDGAAGGQSIRDDTGILDDGGFAKDSILIPEAGDAGSDCEHCQKITKKPPFIIQGEFQREGDVDCYCFEGKASSTYLLGVTGSNRTITAKGPGETKPKTGTDGLLVYSPLKDGSICVCVSGGKPGAYLLTVTPG